MISDFEKKMIAFIAVTISTLFLIIILLGSYSANKRQDCRLEAMKTDRTAEDIVKICP
jgi:fumarate reductase subunit D